VDCIAGGKAVLENVVGVVHRDGPTREEKNNICVDLIRELSAGENLDNKFISHNNKITV